MPCKTTGTACANTGECCQFGRVEDTTTNQLVPAGGNTCVCGAVHGMHGGTHCNVIPANGHPPPFGANRNNARGCHAPPTPAPTHATDLSQGTCENGLIYVHCDDTPAIIERFCIKGEKANEAQVTCADFNLVGNANQCRGDDPSWRNVAQCGKLLRFRVTGEAARKLRTVGWQRTLRNRNDIGIDMTVNEVARQEYSNLLDADEYYYDNQNYKHNRRDRHHYQSANPPVNHQYYDQQQQESQSVFGPYLPGYQQPVAVSPDNSSSMDYVTILALSLIIFVLVCLLCVAINAFIAGGCYLFGKKTSKIDFKTTRNKDHDYQEVNDIE